MRAQSPPATRWLATMLRKPMTWITLALLVLIAAATAAVGVELYASTAMPMVMNPR